MIVEAIHDPEEQLEVTTAVEILVTVVGGNTTISVVVTVENEHPDEMVAVGLQGVETGQKLGQKCDLEDVSLL